MKQFKGIFLLSGFCAAIVIFWLVPGINNAKSGYVRIFEDTEPKRAIVKHTPLAQPTSSDEAERKSVKKYVQQKIDAEATLEDLELEMFSRATHFHEDILAMDSILLMLQDTVQLISTPNDSIQLSAVDPFDETETIRAGDTLDFQIQ